MNEKITVVLAKTVDLSHNPIHRHREVLGIVADPKMVGDLQVIFNPSDPLTTKSGERTLVSNTVLPILGRRALVDIAKSIELINEGEN